MSLRFRRDMTTVRYEQSGVRRQIEEARRKGADQQKVVGEFKSKIADLKNEKKSMTTNIEIAKEKLEDLQTREKRRSSTRLEDD
jgi:chromosome segregation ATPase